MSRQVFDEIKDLITESRNPATMEIDAKSTLDILQLINHEDRKIADVVAKEIPHIAEAVELIVAAFKNGGRLFYVGAGTSGRLGVLDASECPPTYGTDPEMIQGLKALKIFLSRAAWICSSTDFPLKTCASALPRVAALRMFSARWPKPASWAAKRFISFATRARKLPSRWRLRFARSSGRRW
jgi:hypothetical protein